MSLDEITSANHPKRVHRTCPFGSHALILNVRVRPGDVGNLNYEVLESEKLVQLASLSDYRLVVASCVVLAMYTMSMVHTEWDTRRHPTMHMAYTKNLFHMDSHRSADYSDGDDEIFFPWII